MPHTVDCHEVIIISRKGYKNWLSLAQGITCNAKPSKGGSKFEGTGDTYPLKPYLSTSSLLTPHQPQPQTEQ